MRVPEYKNVTFLVRPQRVVTFISKDDKYWEHTAMRLIECYSEVWGGAYNLIVPTDGNMIKEEFWAILERYDPDYIYLYHSTLLDLKLADPKRYKEITDIRESVLSEQYPDMNGSARKEFIRREDESTSISDPRISDCLQKELKQRLSIFQFAGQVVEGYFPADGWPLTKIGDIIQYTDEKEIACFDLENCSREPSLMLLFYSHAGKAGDGYLDTLEGVGIKRQQVTSKYNLSQYFPIDPMGREVLPPTPFSLSMVNLGRYRKKTEYREREEPIVLVLGDTVEDFCFFYCLSRMHRDLYWLPLCFLERYTEATKQGIDIYSSLFQPESMPSRVMSHLYRKIGRGRLQRNIVLTSISLAVDELEERKRELPEPSLSFEPELLGRIRVSKDLYNFADLPWRVFEQGNYSHEQTLAFLDRESIGRLETPRPKNFSLVDPKMHRWITEVMIHEHHLPQLRSLGPQAVLLHENGIRVSSEGLSYLCPNCFGYFGGDIDAELVKPKLKLIDPLDIFRDYFREAGYDYTGLSDKGRYAQETTRKFGLLDEVGRFFSEKRNLNLFDRFLSEKSVCEKETGEVVCVKERAYLDFHAIESALGSKDEAINLIDKLVSQEILHRGFIFQCKRCSNADWYGVEEITDSFICRRCGTQRQYRYENWKSPAEPKWYYKLDEVVFQGYKNNMHVPILTLCKLKVDTASFLYVHELELKKDESQEKPEMEIDVCCIPDGRIVIGESKAPKIPLKDVDKYSCLVGKLSRYPDKLVFSTLEQNVSTDVKNRISSIRNSVLLLQGDLMSD